MSTIENNHEKSPLRSGRLLPAFNHGAICEEMAGSGVMQNSIYNMPIYDELIGQLDMAIDQAREAIVGQLQRLDQAFKKSRKPAVSGTFVHSFS